MPPLSQIGYSKALAAQNLAHIMKITLEQANVILEDVYGFNK